MGKFFLPKKELDAAWDELIRIHISPSRMFEIAIHDKPMTGAETEHLENCESCKWHFDGWKEQKRDEPGPIQ